MLPKLFRKTPLALLQMGSQKTRLLVAIAGIAFADFLMFFQLGVRDALFDSQVRPYATLKGDLFIVNKLSDNLQSIKSFPRDNLYRVAGMDGVNSIRPLYIGQASWRNPDNQASRQIFVYGIDPNRPAFDLPEVEQQLDKLKLLNQVLFDKAGLTPQLGDVTALLKKQNSLSVQANDLEVKVVGLFTLGSSFSAEGNLLMSDSTFLRLFSRRRANDIDLGIIEAKPNVSIEQLQADLQAIVPDNLLVLTLEQFSAREFAYWNTGSSIGPTFNLGVAIGFLVGAVIVYQILYTDVSDHLPEYATLKAMGYSDLYLIGVILQEALLLAILGFLPGFLLASGFYSFFRSVTFLPIAMKSSRAITVLILTVVMCAGAGAIALRKLRAADPADIFSAHLTPFHPFSLILHPSPMSSHLEQVRSLNPISDPPSVPKPVISAHHLNHYFGKGDLRKQTLFGINLDIYPGEIVIMTGPSGSGKTTLLTLMGGLRSVQEGSLTILGQEMCAASKRKMMQVRKQIGYIFQAHNLLTFLTAKQNVRMSLELHPDYLKTDMDVIATEMLEAVGLGERVDYYADSLSGGQKQRVAIARALASRPKIVLADEPTAALDKKSGRDVVEIMQRLAKEQGCTILLVTHDNRILDIADRIIHMEDGRLATASSS